MNPTRFLFVLAFSALFPVGNLLAGALSLSDCLRQAREKSPQAVEASLNEAGARAARDEAAARQHPHLSLDGKYTESDEPLNQLPDDNHAGLKLIQTFFPLTSPSLYKNQREASYRSAVLSHEEATKDVDLLVKQTYFAVLKDEDALSSLRQVKEVVERLQEIILPKYAVGREPPFDLVKIKTILNDLERNKDAQELQYMADQQTLAQLVGADEAQGVALKSLSKLPDIPASKDLSANPSLQALEQERRAAEWGLKVAQNMRRPVMDLSTDAGYSGRTSGDLAAGWGLSLGLSMPLFDAGEITARAAQEKARMQASTKKSEAETILLGYELIRAEASAKFRRRDLDRLKALLPEVHRASSAAVTRYRQGAVGIIEASDAVGLWLDTLLNERAAYYGFLSDLAQMERLLGTEVVRYED